MAVPTITKHLDIYEGKTIECAAVNVVDPIETELIFPNIVPVEGDYVFQMVARTDSGSNYLTVSAGDKTEGVTIGTSFKRFVLKFENVNPLYFQELAIRFANTGTVYLYNLQLERATQASGWRPAPEDVDEIANSYAVSAVQNQSQKDIFDKLTNGGETQGIYLQDGKIYINAAFLRVGSVPTEALEDSIKSRLDNGQTAYDRSNSYYGICDTADGTSSKIVKCDGFELKEGAVITIYFSKSQRYAASFTLNVNGTGAKNIYIGLYQQGPTNFLLWNEDATLTFAYNGSAYVLQDQPSVYYGTKCTTAADTAAKTTMTTSHRAVIMAGTKISVPMNNANTNEKATLNVNSIAAIPIYYGTTNTTPTTANNHGWIAGETAEFILDGQHWRVIEPATIIDGGHIRTGTLDASLVNVTNLNANNIVAGKISSVNPKIYFNLNNGELACDRIVAVSNDANLTNTIARMLAKEYSSGSYRYGLDVYRSDISYGGVMLSPSSNASKPAASIHSGSMYYPTGLSLIAVCYDTGNSNEPTQAGNTPSATVGSISSVTTQALQFNRNGELMLHGTGYGPASSNDRLPYVRMLAGNYNPNSNGQDWGRIMVHSPSNLDLYCGSSCYVKVYGKFTATGAKNRVVETSDYGNRLLSCYETPTPMFGDIGEGQIGEDGLAYIWIDSIFSETISTASYQVFLQQYGEGDAYVFERKDAYFIVKGTPGLNFGWELKAKQIDLDQTRLAKEEGYAIPHSTYGENALIYIEELKEGRLLK